MHVKNRILIAFLFPAIISVFFVAMLGFFSAKDVLLRITIKQLETLTDLKANLLQTFFEDLKDAISIASDYYNIKTSLPVMIKFCQDRSHPDYIKGKEILDGQLRKWLKVKEEVIDLMLVSPEGKVVYTANEGHMKFDLDKTLLDPEAETFEKGKKGIFVSQIFRSPYEGYGYKFGLLVAAPVFDFENQFIGVVVFEISMDRAYKLIQDTTGLGNTGETVVARKEGDYLLFLNPLRFDPDAALKRKVYSGDKTLIPAQEADSGKISSGIVKDYRGKEVVAAWRYIPVLGWKIVAKIDLREVLIPVITLRNRIALFCVAIIILLVIELFMIAESIVKPIRILHKGTEMVGRGNLDYKVGIDTKDEIGQLSRAFDQMAGNLKKITASRDELSRETAARQETEEKLQVSETCYRRLFESAKDGIFVLDAASGKIVDVNPFLEELAGYSRDELLGKEIGELGIFKNAVNSKQAFFELQDKESIHYEDMSLQAKDGRRIDIEFVSNICAVNRSNKVIQCNIRNISDRKRAEKKLQEAVRAKSAFTSMVSHELRTPLGALKESVALVSEGALGAVNPEQKRFLGIAKGNVDRLARLINDVLDFQKLENGKMVFTIQDNDINEVVKETKETMNIIAKAKGLDFILNLDQGLPKIKFDRDKISQVLINLASNSLKAAEKGAITISTAKENGVIQVSVKDTGPGIKEEDLPRLFQQYEQLERKTGGTGLGLAISSEIIKAHGGKIWAESTFGQGTTMHFILPA